MTSAENRQPPSNGNESLTPEVAVVGGGPAGLMAAETLAAGGVQVDLYDAMPTLGRKFLLAGVGGMNITHSEPLDTFIGRFGTRAEIVGPWLKAFSPHGVRDWVHALDVETFVGSSGRVFPTDMKAAPLLRHWTHRLRASGVRFHMRHRWLGWQGDALHFSGPDGDAIVRPRAVVFALGGGSWPKLGSDGAWVPIFSDQAIAVAPLVPANCGFDVAGGWSAHLRNRFAGQPVKTVAVRFTDAQGARHERSGELALSDTGIEGSLVYALSAPLRDALAAAGRLQVELDLAPDKSAERVAAEVAHPRGARSLSSHLQSRAGIKGVKMGLLRELLTPEQLRSPVQLARAIKALPLTLTAPRPLAEAISSAGGVLFDALDGHLMVRSRPGVFCAGEMLDWEAPTGGYLLTTCLASGRWAGQGALSYLAQTPATPIDSN